MVNCGAYGKFLAMNGAATCATCGVKFHRACLALPDKAKLNKDWESPNCKKATRRGDNSQTPSGAVDQLSLSEMKVLRNEILECVKGMREFRSEMELLRASFASVCVRMDGIEQRLQALEQRSPDLSDDRVALLEQTISGLKLELNDRDQEALLTDLKIGQMPEDKAENAFHSVCVLATRLGVPLEERDVVYAERVGARLDEAGGRPRRMVVRLARRSLRDELLRAARLRRTGLAAEAGLRIYINERLTRFNRQLFHRVREECRRLQWRYCWTRRGRIFARQGEGRQVFQLRSEMDISRVFGSGA
ncbi:hypothetical protein ACJJTC_000919 [Scirpophaga incertulas]